jgi:hypothetical protein
MNVLAIFLLVAGPTLNPVPATIGSPTPPPAHVTKPMPITVRFDAYPIDFLAMFRSKNPNYGTYDCTNAGMAGGQVYADLKAAFTSEKAYLSEHNRFSDSALEIGFVPEWTKSSLCYQWTINLEHTAVPRRFFVTARAPGLGVYCIASEGGPGGPAGQPRYSPAAMSVSTIEECTNLGPAPQLAPAPIERPKPL